MDPNQFTITAQQWVYKAHWYISHYTRATMPREELVRLQRHVQLFDQEVVRNDPVAAHTLAALNHTFNIEQTLDLALAPGALNSLLNTFNGHTSTTPPTSSALPLQQPQPRPAIPQLQTLIARPQTLMTRPQQPFPHQQPLIPPPQPLFPQLPPNAAHQQLGGPQYQQQQQPPAPQQYPIVPQQPYQAPRQLPAPEQPQPPKQGRKKKWGIPSRQNLFYYQCDLCGHRTKDRMDFRRHMRDGARREKFRVLPDPREAPTGWRGADRHGRLFSGPMGRSTEAFSKFKVPGQCGHNIRALGQAKTQQSKAAKAAAGETKLAGKKPERDEDETEEDEAEDKADNEEENPQDDREDEA